MENKENQPAEAHELYNEDVAGGDRNSAREVPDRTGIETISTTIKERPINKKRLFRRYLLTAFSALIFGFVACLTFIAIEPPLSDLIHPGESPSIVEFPEETVESVETEVLPENMLSLPEETRNNMTVEEVQEIVSQELDSKTGSSQPITTEDLHTLALTLSGVARQASESMVTVSVVTEATDWFDNSYEASGTSPGIIVADNGIERLVLTCAPDLEDAEDLRVTFSDGIKVRARIKASDFRTGMTILAVSHKLMPEETLLNAVPILLGSSMASQLSGMPVIALLPQGAVSYGTASLATRQISLPDINLKLIQTDIYTMDHTAGFLVNLRGQLVGVADGNHNLPELPNALCAFGITELRLLVENLSNGTPLPFLGVLGQDITEEISATRHIPRGAYITDTELNSPAMRIGLRAGDIVSAFDSAELLSFRALTEKLMECREGSTHRLTVLREAQGEYRDEVIEVELEGYY